MYNDIESLHNRGVLPDRYYYQLNGKTPQENFELQRKKIYKELQSRKEESFIISIIEKMLQSAVDEALKEILKPLTK